MEFEGSPRTILFKSEMKLLKRQSVDLSSYQEKEFGREKNPAFESSDLGHPLCSVMEAGKQPCG